MRTSGPGSDTRTVLLVEDEPLVRDMAAAMLQHAGYAVLKARNGAEALRSSSEFQGHLDLLLTDMCMQPGMNGRQLAALLRQVRPGIPVLYISGYFEDDEVAKELESGQAHFLQKPFSRENFLDKVKHALLAPVNLAQSA